MVKNYLGDEMDDETDYMQEGFKLVSGDPSLHRIELYLAKILEILESRRITKNLTKGEKDLTALTKILKNELKKSKSKKTTGLKGFDFMRPYRVGSD